ncbi:uncharacterized protein CDAR_526581 [Caerostris darwini]|uniref:Uncharacterized protein n=1 Tax=Caerostris darwini TaxID=1538125 RepID=A0AAV4T580_9ARAC|nr:uncharacterized protein CDAR_526581 [Caerostris darwini]
MCECKYIFIHFSINHTLKVKITSYTDRMPRLLIKAKFEKKHPEESRLIEDFASALKTIKRNTISKHVFVSLYNNWCRKIQLGISSLIETSEHFHSKIAPTKLEQFFVSVLIGLSFLECIRCQNPGYCLTGIGLCLLLALLSLSTVIHLSFTKPNNALISILNEISTLTFISKDLCYKLHHTRKLFKVIAGPNMLYRIRRRNYPFLLPKWKDCVSAFILNYTSWFSIYGIVFSVQLSILLTVFSCAEFPDILQCFSCVAMLIFAIVQDRRMKKIQKEIHQHIYELESETAKFFEWFKHKSKVKILLEKYDFLNQELLKLFNREKEEPLTDPQSFLIFSVIIVHVLYGLQYSINDRNLHNMLRYMLFNRQCGYTKHTKLNSKPQIIVSSTVKTQKDLISCMNTLLQFGSIIKESNLVSNIPDEIPLENRSDFVTTGAAMSDEIIRVVDSFSENNQKRFKADLHNIVEKNNPETELIYDVPQSNRSMHLSSEYKRIEEVADRLENNDYLEDEQGENMSGIKATMRPILDMEEETAFEDARNGIEMSSQGDEIKTIPGIAKRNGSAKFPNESTSALSANKKGSKLTTESEQSVSVMSTIDESVRTQKIRDVPQVEESGYLSLNASVMDTDTGLILEIHFLVLISKVFAKKQNQNINETTSPSPKENLDQKCNDVAMESVQSNAKMGSIDESVTAHKISDISEESDSLSSENGFIELLNDTYSRQELCLNSEKQNVSEETGSALILKETTSAPSPKENPDQEYNDAPMESQQSIAEMGTIDESIAARKIRDVSQSGDSGSLSSKDSVMKMDTRTLNKYTEETESVHILNKTTSSPSTKEIFDQQGSDASVTSKQISKQMGTNDESVTSQNISDGPQDEDFDSLNSKYSVMGMDTDTVGSKKCLNSEKEFIKTEGKANGIGETSKQAETMNLDKRFSNKDHSSNTGGSDTSLINKNAKKTDSAERKVIQNFAVVNNSNNNAETTKSKEPERDQSAQSINSNQQIGKAEDSPPSKDINQVRKKIISIPQDLLFYLRSQKKTALSHENLTKIISEYKKEEKFCNLVREFFEYNKKIFIMRNNQVNNELPKAVVEQTPLFKSDTVPSNVKKTDPIVSVPQSFAGTNTSESYTKIQTKEAARFQFDFGNKQYLNSEKESAETLVKENLIGETSSQVETMNLDKGFSNEGHSSNIGGSDIKLTNEITKTGNVKGCFTEKTRKDIKTMKDKESSIDVKDQSTQNINSYQQIDNSEDSGSAKHNNQVRNNFPNSFRQLSYFQPQDRNFSSFGTPNKLLSDNYYTDEKSMLNIVGDFFKNNEKFRFIENNQKIHPTNNEPTKEVTEPTALTENERDKRHEKSDKRSAAENEVTVHSENQSTANPSFNYDFSGNKYKEKTISSEISSLTSGLENMSIGSVEKHKTSKNKDKTKTNIFATNCSYFQKYGSEKIECCNPVTFTDNLKESSEGNPIVETPGNGCEQEGDIFNAKSETFTKTSLNSKHTLSKDKICHKMRKLRESKNAKNQGRKILKAKLNKKENTMHDEQNDKEESSFPTNVPVTQTLTEENAVMNMERKSSTKINDTLANFVNNMPTNVPQYNFFSKKYENTPRVYFTVGKKDDNTYESRKTENQDNAVNNYSIQNTLQKEEWLNQDKDKHGQQKFPKVPNAYVSNLEDEKNSINSNLQETHATSNEKSQTPYMQSSAVNNTDEQTDSKDETRGAKPKALDTKTNGQKKEKTKNKKKESKPQISNTQPSAEDNNSEKSKEKDKTSKSHQKVTDSQSNADNNGKDGTSKPAPQGLKKQSNAQINAHKKSGGEDESGNVQQQVPDKQPSADDNITEENKTKIKNSETQQQTINEPITDNDLSEQNKGKDGTSKSEPQGFKKQSNAQINAHKNSGEDESGNVQQVPGKQSSADDNMTEENKTKFKNSETQQQTISAPIADNNLSEQNKGKDGTSKPEPQGLKKQSNAQINAHKKSGEEDETGNVQYQVPDKQSSADDNMTGENKTKIKNSETQQQTISAPIADNNLSEQNKGKDGTSKPEPQVLKKQSNAQINAQKKSGGEDESGNVQQVPDKQPSADDNMTEKNKTKFKNSETQQQTISEPIAYNNLSEQNKGKDETSKPEPQGLKKQSNAQINAHKKSGEEDETGNVQYQVPDKQSSADDNMTEENKTKIKNSETQQQTISAPIADNNLSEQNKGKDGTSKPEPQVLKKQSSAQINEPKKSGGEDESGNVQQQVPDKQPSADDNMTGENKTKIKNSETQQQTISEPIADNNLSEQNKGKDGTSKPEPQGLKKQSSAQINAHKKSGEEDETGNVQQQVPDKQPRADDNMTEENKTKIKNSETQQQTINEPIADNNLSEQNKGMDGTSKPEPQGLKKQSNAEINAHKKSGGEDESGNVQQQLSVKQSSADDNITEEDKRKEKKGCLSNVPSSSDNIGREKNKTKDKSSEAEQVTNIQPIADKSLSGQNKGKDDANKLGPQVLNKLSNADTREKNERKDATIKVQQQIRDNKSNTANNTTDSKVSDIQSRDGNKIQENRGKTGEKLMNGDAQNMAENKFASDVQKIQVALIDEDKSITENKNFTFMPNLQDSNDMASGKTVENITTSMGSSALDIIKNQQDKKNYFLQPQKTYAEVCKMSKTTKHESTKKDTSHLDRLTQEGLSANSHDLQSSKITTDETEKKDINHLDPSTQEELSANSHPKPEIPEDPDEKLNKNKETGTAMIDNSQITVETGNSKDTVESSTSKNLEHTEKTLAKNGNATDLRNNNSSNASGENEMKDIIHSSDYRFETVSYANSLITSTHEKNLEDENTLQYYENSKNLELDSDKEEDIFEDAMEDIQDSLKKIVMQSGIDESMGDGFSHQLTPSYHEESNITQERQQGFEILLDNFPNVDSEPLLSKEQTMCFDMEMIDSQSEDSNHSSVTTDYDADHSSRFISSDSFLSTKQHTSSSEKFAMDGKSITKSNKPKRRSYPHQNHSFSSEEDCKPCWDDSLCEPVNEEKNFANAECMDVDPEHNIIVSEQSEIDRKLEDGKYATAEASEKQTEQALEDMDTDLDMASKILLADASENGETSNKAESIHHGSKESENYQMNHKTPICRLECEDMRIKLFDPTSEINVQLTYKNKNKQKFSRKIGKRYGRRANENSENDSAEDYQTVENSESESSTSDNRNMPSKCSSELSNTNPGTITNSQAEEDSEAASQASASNHRRVLSKRGSELPVAENLEMNDTDQAEFGHLTKRIRLENDEPFYFVNNSIELKLKPGNRKKSIKFKFCQIRGKKELNLRHKNMHLRISEKFEESK